MLFTIVSERQGVTNREKCASPQEALAHASTLIQSGVEKVWVFDARGAFVSASALSELARSRIENSVPPAPMTSCTTDLLAHGHESTRPRSGNAETTASETPAVSEGSALKNARVFRMATQRF